MKKETTEKLKANKMYWTELALNGWTEVSKKFVLGWLKGTVQIWL